MLAGDLIWEKSESASVDGSRREPAVDEQRVEQFLTDPEAEGGGGGGVAKKKCDVSWSVRVLLRRRRGFFASSFFPPLFFYFTFAWKGARPSDTHTPTPSAFSLNV